MPSYNKVLLMGNITRDIELRYTPNNTAVADIGIAVNRKWRNQQGEMQEEVSFVDCTAWGRTAEVMSQYLGKGRPVFVEGRLQLDQWQDQQGQNRSKLKVVIEAFEFIDSRGGGQGGGGDGGGNRSSQNYDDNPGQRQSVPAGASHQPVPEDDIPF